MNTDCILESVGEVLERDRSGIDGDFLPVRISQSTHSFCIVCQIKLSTVYAVLVIEPFGGVADALLARVLDGL